MAWILQQDKNNGYPTNTNFPATYTASWSGDYPWGWILQPQYNSGYPFRHPWFPSSSGGSGDGSGGDIGGSVKDSGDLTNIIPNRYGTNTNIQFVMNILQFRTLQSYINGTLIPSNPDEIPNFMGTNPQEYIVSVQLYPFSLPTATQQTNIKLGCVDTGITAYILKAYGTSEPNNNLVTYDFGEIELPKFGDFRDYECNFIIQLPFIGSYELDAKIWAGQTIGLRYIIDFNTGKISAVLKRSNLNCNIDVECYSGTISATLPLFAANMGQYQNALASIEYAIEQSKIKQISSAIGGFTSMGSSFINENPISGVNSIVGAAGSIVASQSQQQYAQYQLEHTKPHVSSISVASPLNAFYMDDRARIIITKPVFMQGYDAEIYKRTVGYACCYQSIVGNENGLIVCSNIKCNGIMATTDEIKAIKDAFSAGVIV
jgi:hypothetical protein